MRQTYVSLDHFTTWYRKEGHFKIKNQKETYVPMIV